MWALQRGMQYFNPRSPCGERQPTPKAPQKHKKYFNPRSPCGERHTRFAPAEAGAIISIHAPRAGSDAVTQNTPDQTWTFQSTLPVRGATKKDFQSNYGGAISIHAPRAGSDARTQTIKLAHGAFQSTLPVRGATLTALTGGIRLKFQSTLPVRGATA